MGMIDASPFAFRVTGRMEAKDGVIEHRLKSFLMAARAGSQAICAAIEKFIGFEKRKRSE
jgi:hypothetical protein